MSIPTGRKRNPESAILSSCLQLLHLRGIFCFRVNQGPIPLAGGKGFRRFAGLRGVSDIIGICSVAGRGGVMLAVEVKTPAGRLSPEQSAFLEEIRARGGVAVVVRSVAELEAAIEMEGLS